MVMIFGKPLPLLFGQLLLGIINGSFYAMLSMGLAIIFGLLNIINFAHGAMFMVGAFVAWGLFTYLGIGFWAALVCAPIIVGVFGLLLERAFIRRIYKLDILYGLLLTFGMAQVLQGLATNYFGSSGVSYNAPDALSGVLKLGFMYLPVYRGFVVVRRNHHLLRDLVRGRENAARGFAARGHRKPVARAILRCERATSHRTHLRRRCRPRGPCGRACGAALFGQSGYGRSTYRHRFRGRRHRRDGLDRWRDPHRIRAWHHRGFYRRVLSARLGGRCVRGDGDRAAGPARRPFWQDRLNVWPDATPMLGFAVLVVVVIAAPFILYPIVVMQVMCYAIFAMGTNFLMGSVGLLSLGQAAYFGLGGYVAGYLVESLV